jgi:hypothetical protein
MATVINNPAPAERIERVDRSDSGSGFLVAMILLILAIIAFFYYGLPYLSAGMNQGPQVNVPDKVDVNVQQPQK